MDRIDKILALNLNITRSNAKKLLQSKRVTLDGEIASANDKCDSTATICVDGEEINAQKFVYIMMNKPKGVISASEGNGDKTVVDILPKKMKRRGLFPAGRLDKDTTGFMLITDDGEFAHNILSPKKHIDKTYIATLDKPFNDKISADFENGMLLNDEKLLKAQIESLNDSNTMARVVLKQGLYHQVKRMFKKHGITVTELERIKIGDLELDKSLKPGECRYISADELKMIQNA